jgi:hypothetical protein
MPNKIEFTQHASDMLVFRQIPKEVILYAIDNPDFVELSLDGNKHFIKSIKSLIFVIKE